MQHSQTGLLKGTRDTDAPISLPLPTNRGVALGRLSSGHEDAQKRRQARVKARRMQPLVSETADEREMCLCRRR